MVYELCDKDLSNRAKPNIASSGYFVIIEFPARGDGGWCFTMLISTWND